jgi:hypothetical protein
VYVSVALVLVLVCGCVLLAFMFPRSASLSLLAVNSSEEWAPLSNDSTSLTLPMETHIQIQNDNFFRLQVQWLQVLLFNVGVQVGSMEARTFSVGARQASTAVVTQNATFKGNLKDKVQMICKAGGWKHTLSMTVQAEMEYTVLSHTSEAVASKLFYVSCDVIQTDS